MYCLKLDKVKKPLGLTRIAVRMMLQLSMHAYEKEKD